MSARRFRPAWLPYVAPIATFLILTSVVAWLSRLAGSSSPAWYPPALVVLLMVVAVVAWFCRSTWIDLLPMPRTGGWIVSILTGLAVTAFWIAAQGHYPRLPLSGARMGFDPDFLPGATRYEFLVVRLMGLVILVPLMEEIFWRSFLIRWAVREDFRAVPIGRVTPWSAGVTAALFALAHPEWLPALAAGLVWALLLWRTRSVTACVISHAVSNLSLGIYILATRSWGFW